MPVITQQGHGGGITLGFDFRTRLTGLTEEEAESMALILVLMPQELADLGLARAGARAQAKLRETFPDQTRRQMAATLTRFAVPAPAPDAADPRRAALGRAVREGCMVWLQVSRTTGVLVHPVGLELSPGGWTLICGRTRARFAETEWGDINISARRFAASGA